MVKLDKRTSKAISEMATDKLQLSAIENKKIVTREMSKSFDKAIDSK